MITRYWLTLIALVCSSVANAAALELEAKIPLGDVHGRIDHLAIDVKRQRLYVAELGNDTVGVVDLKDRKTVRTLTGLTEPQGIGYVPSIDTVFVANAGDGSVRLFQGAELTPAGQISLGDDADNVRVDDAANRVFVGYGSGALAVIDITKRQKIADIPLNAHPESFQLEASGDHIIVNVPDARQIALADRKTGKQLAAWSTGRLSANFPLAIDAPGERAIAIFRHPATLGAFGLRDGRLLATVKTCGDADDVFIDAKRKRIYVICGEGVVDVLAAQGESIAETARIPTAGGARTGLFVPELDLLLVAVRASGSSAASVWVFRPSSG
jgi:hypothetical protein